MGQVTNSIVGISYKPHRNQLGHTAGKGLGWECSLDVLGQLSIYLFCPTGRQSIFNMKTCPALLPTTSYPLTSPGWLLGSRLFQDFHGAFASLTRKRSQRRSLELVRGFRHHQIYFTNEGTAQGRERTGQVSQAKTQVSIEHC